MSVKTFLKSPYYAGSLLALLGSLLAYWLTVDPTASYWDCPEYILTAQRLEVGHPPGNPAWALASNVVANAALLFGGLQNVALAINLSSGLFTALAVMLLFQILWFALRYVLPQAAHRHPLATGALALSGALLFGWSDSPWFSAVEAEVYAMSLMLTALTVRLGIAWARTRDRGRRGRLLCLIAYITGLSIGVHELNLLAIPFLALLFYFFRLPPEHRRKPMQRPRTRGMRLRRLLAPWVAMGLGTLLLGFILMVVYPGLISAASPVEIWAVNSLGLSFGSGVIIYLCLLAVLLIAIPLVLNALHCHRWALYTGAFSLLVVGMGVYMLIPVRAMANTPVNEGAPADVSSFLSYVKRDQYGKRPLFYGYTTYSEPLMQESRDSAGRYVYKEVVRKKGRPRYMRAMPDGVISSRTGLLTSADSLDNARARKRAASGNDAYYLADYTYDIVYTPELDMFFPRLTGRSPGDRANYECWTGMNADNMEKVKVSYALDSLGNPVGQMGADGKRTRKTSYRPTILQNLTELLGYQISYMYLRYLMWNFAGRQNDYPSTGEIEHGNFITGIGPIDDAMLGPQSTLPPELGSDNKGRNVFYLIPFALGIAGIIWLCRRGRRGKRVCALTLLLFLMTGIAIVVFLNQDPGEARERDYSFMGSFLAFTVWIFFGMTALCRLLWRLGQRIASRLKEAGSRQMARRLSLLLCSAVAAFLPVWMLAVNYADHDRSGRRFATEYTIDILESLEPDAIFFTDGDNYTFPFWYAQEVLGVRRDVTIINRSYLTTAWYLEQLMTPGEDGRKPLTMTATPAGIRYEAFSLVKLPKKLMSDTLRSTDALEELKHIYATPGRMASLSAGKLRLPPAAPGLDSVSITLAKAFPGRSSVSLRDIATLDIVATNAASAKPRPIYWLDLLGSSHFAGFYPYTSSGLFTRRYDPAGAGRYRTDEGLAMLPRLHTGGADRPVYNDPYVGRHITRQRVWLLRLAGHLAEEGRHADALRVARFCLSGFTSQAWPYQSVTENKKTRNEGLWLADILRTSGAVAGDSRAVASGDSLRAAELQRLDLWLAWYRSLPAEKRDLISDGSRRLIISAQHKQ